MYITGGPETPYPPLSRASGNQNCHPHPHYRAPWYEILWGPREADSFAPPQKICPTGPVMVEVGGGHYGSERRFDSCVGLKPLRLSRDQSFGSRRGPPLRIRRHVIVDHIIVLEYIMQYHVISNHIISHHIISNIVVGYVMLCYVMLCYVIL